MKEEKFMQRWIKKATAVAIVAAVIAAAQAMLEAARRHIGKF